MTLLTVLKIIGIVILVLLGLILFLLLLVLFVPVRYRGKGSYQNGTFMTTLRVSWLLHIVSVMGAYQNEQELHLVLKIFGIPFFDTFRNKKAKSTKTKRRPASEIQAASSDEDWGADEEFYQEYEEFEDGARDIFHTTVIQPSLEKDDTVNRQAQRPFRKPRRKLNIIQKIKDFFSKFVNFFKKLKFTFNKVCDTMVRIKKNIKYYLEILQCDSTKQALTVCWGQFGRIIRKIAPRKFSVNLHLGFEDPAMMGQVLAVWGMLYPVHMGAVDIQPEFDQTVLEGEFSFRGRVSVFVFVHAGCILFFNKDLKRLIKSLRQKEI